MDILKEFGVDPLLLVAQIVNFLILLFILRKFMYGPILKVLDTRKKKIEESLKNAEEIEKVLAKTNEETERMISKALLEQEKMLTESKVMVAQMINDGKVQASQIIAKAQQQAQELIQAERGKLEQEVKQNLSTIVSLALEKVLGKTISRLENKKIIEKAVREI